jgi:patatin-like phospholipase/acyl hydrolase
MLKLYTERGSEIFERSFWRGITSLGGAIDEQYSHKPLEKVLKQYLGDATLKDCLVPVVITSYDIEQREPYFFKIRRALEKKTATIFSETPLGRRQLHLLSLSPQCD